VNNKNEKKNLLKEGKIATAERIVQEGLFKVLQKI